MLSHFLWALDPTEFPSVNFIHSHDLESCFVKVIFTISFSFRANCDVVTVIYNDFNKISLHVSIWKAHSWRCVYFP